MKKYFSLISYIAVVIFFLGCIPGNSTDKARKTNLKAVNGKTVITRFNAPAGFLRAKADPHSFAEYLRTLPLKPDGAKVKLYDGHIKQNDVYDAVVDMEIGDKDLQQCADAVMRLRGEYLFREKRYHDISFNFNSGFVCDYDHWMNGYRVKVVGNNATWIKQAEISNTYADFRTYMDVVFDYAGTLALSKMLKRKPLQDLEIGDVLIKGGTPGHAVIVIDVAVDSSGHKAFMLAQSYMPAQDIQVLKNYNHEETSPWYYLSEIKDAVYTPEWKFGKDQLMGFR
jgi:hypothetical protein